MSQQKGADADHDCLICQNRLMITNVCSVCDTCGIACVLSSGINMFTQGLGITMWLDICVKGRVLVP